MWNYDNPSQINILTTNIPSDYRVPTLMHDHLYRLGIAWQNVAYNQPPHLSYYLPSADFSYREVVDGIEVVESQEEPFGIYSLTGLLVRKDAKTIEGLPKGIYIVNKKKVLVR
jgi:rhamnogalacturonan endolyase